MVGQFHLIALGIAKAMFARDEDHALLETNAMANDAKSGVADEHAGIVDQRSQSLRLAKVKEFGMLWHVDSAAFLNDYGLIDAGCQLVHGFYQPLERGLAGAHGGKDHSRGPPYLALGKFFNAGFHCTRKRSAKW